MEQETNERGGWLQNPWVQRALAAAGGIAGGPLVGMGLSAMFRGGGMNFGGMGQNLSGGMRGIGTSFNRMFDGNNQTGFFNNPTAPWNWGRGPMNVSESHPDFMGPPRPTPGQQQPPPPSPQGEDSLFSGNFGSAVQGGGGNQMAAWQQFQANTPGHWRDYGSAGRAGAGGNQNTGIGPFGSFMTGERGQIQMHDSVR